MTLYSQPRLSSWRVRLKMQSDWWLLTIPPYVISVLCHSRCQIHIIKWMSLVLLVSIGYRVKMWLSVFHPAKKILSYKLYILLSFSILSYTILYLNQACFGLHVFTFLLSVWFTYCDFFFTKISQFHWKVSFYLPVCTENSLRYLEDEICVLFQYNFSTFI